MMNGMEDKAKDLVYGEIGDFAEDMMLGGDEGADLMKNRAKPENMPGDDPSEPGVTFSDDEMGMLESEYGAKCETNY